MLQPSFLHRRASDALQKAAYAPKKLVLLHTVIGLGSFLLTTLINYLLSLSFADNGGLSGMELQAMLASIQSILELAVTVGLPFWNIGLFFAALRWAREESAVFSDLLQGFRRLPSVLGMLLLRTGAFLILGFGIVNISSTVYMMTPFAEGLINLLTPIVQQGNAAEGLMSEAVIAALWKEMLPLLILSGVLFAAAAIPLFYRLRFSDFAVMSGLTCGKAVTKSLAITRKNCLQILRLDLSFWWYYLLLGLCILLSYGDALLGALGISLPMSATAASFMFYLLGLIAQCLLLWQCEARRLTAYALACRSLAGEVAASSETEAL